MKKSKTITVAARPRTVIFILCWLWLPQILEVASESNKRHLLRCPWDLMHGNIIAFIAVERKEPIASQHPRTATTLVVIQMKAKPTIAE